MSWIPCDKCGAPPDWIGRIDDALKSGFAAVQPSADKAFAKWEEADAEIGRLKAKVGIDWQQENRDTPHEAR